MTDRPARSPIARALVGAALFLGASAAIAVASPEYIGEELARRLWGVILGAVVVIYANAAPRALTPLARMRCDAAAEQAVRRFSGRALVLGGLGFAGAWLFAPIGAAGYLAMGFLGFALLLVLVRCRWPAAAGRSSP